LAWIKAELAIPITPRHTATRRAAYIVLH